MNVFREPTIELPQPFYLSSGRIMLSTEELVDLLVPDAALAEEALRPMPLLFSNDSLRRHIDTDPDDEPTAGPIEEARTRSKT